MYIIGDVHGCKKTLEALLAQLDPTRKVCFVGDLIDRGPESKGVVDLVRSMIEAGTAYCVQGNHEDMTSLDSWNRDWLMNGGHTVIPNYDLGFKDPQLKKDIEWMHSLPVVLEFEDLKNDEGRHLVVSHSATTKITDFKQLKMHERDTILWNRTILRPGDYPTNIFNVFGHTPTEKPIITKEYANIDTGCVYFKAEGYGKLTALSFPDMKVYQQDYVG